MGKKRPKLNKIKSPNPWPASAIIASAEHGCSLLFFDFALVALLVVVVAEHEENCWRSVSSAFRPPRSIRYDFFSDAFKKGLPFLSFLSFFATWQKKKKRKKNDNILCARLSSARKRFQRIISRDDDDGDEMMCCALCVSVLLFSHHLIIIISSSRVLCGVCWSLIFLHLKIYPNRFCTLLLSFWSTLHVYVFGFCNNFAFQRDLRIS